MFYKLFTNCKLCKGANRSAIYDFQVNAIHLIPNSLYDILSNPKYTQWDDVKADFEPKYHQIIDEYYCFLKSKGLIMEMEEMNHLNHFPNLNDNWESSSLIENCIVDFNSDSVLISNSAEATFKYFETIVLQLNDLLCSHIQIRMYNSTDLSIVKAILESFNHSTITNIELLVCYNSAISESDWISLCDENIRLTDLTIHSCLIKKNIGSTRYDTPINYITGEIDSHLHCGKISELFFSPNHPTYAESLVNNTCLNRKISIDVDGNIKNCPSMKESFGNIRKTRLIEAYSTLGFKKYWNISKEQVIKCRDCEFRHACTDCRAFLEDPNDNYSAPLKCGYDPYSCQWEDWSNNPLKQKAIEYYCMQINS